MKPKAQVWKGSFEIWYWKCTLCDEDYPTIMRTGGGTAGSPAIAGNDARLHLLIMHGWTKLTPIEVFQ